MDEKKIGKLSHPTKLIGKDGLYGPIPNRLYPIFRDRDELAGSAQLGPLIEQALTGFFSFNRSLFAACGPVPLGE